MNPLGSAAVHCRSHSPGHRPHVLLTFGCHVGPYCRFLGASGRVTSLRDAFGTVTTIGAGHRKVGVAGRADGVVPVATLSGRVVGAVGAGACAVLVIACRPSAQPAVPGCGRECEYRRVTCFASVHNAHGGPRRKFLLRDPGASATWILAVSRSRPVVDL